MTGVPRSILPFVAAVAVSVSACGDPSALVSPEPQFSVAAVSQGGNTYAYVANVHSANVSVVDVGTNAVVATIGLNGAPSLPGGVAASPDGKFVYVTNRAGSVWVVDAVNNTVAASILLGGTDVQDIAVTPDGRFAYATQRNNASVAVIDLGARLQVATIGVGALPTKVAFSPDGQWAYVANFLSHEVSVIDVASHAVIETIPVGVFPNDLAVSKSGRRVFTADWGSSSVTVIDATSRTVSDSWWGGAGTWTLDLSPDDSTLFVGNWSSSNKGLTKIKTSTGWVLDQFAVPVEQTNIEVTPDGGRVYMTDFSGANGNGHTVVVVDAVTGAVLSSIPVGEAPYGMVMTAARNPVTAEDCKDGGWQGFGFRNQGLCMQFVNTGKDSR